MKRRAVFLDRDGVINHNWFNPNTGEWESPMRPVDLKLCEGVLPALGRLQLAGFMLFLVSNQPSAAKGKCSLNDLKSVHDELRRRLDAAGVMFADFFYSYAHPDAVDPALREPLFERKPSPYFLEHAINSHDLDRTACWMVGDRDTDVECGQRAGVRTIQVESTESDGKNGKANPEARASNLADAVAIITGD